MCIAKGLEGNNTLEILKVADYILVKASLWFYLQLREIVIFVANLSIIYPSRQSRVQDKDRADLKELRFISSLSTFSRPFHITALL